MTITNYSAGVYKPLEMARGKMVGVRAVHKFGHSDQVGTTLVPVADGLVYQTPSVKQSLEVVSNHAGDSSAGLGARKIKITGISDGWLEVSEIVTLDGVTPVALVNQYFRIFRVCIVESGTYANQVAGSHLGTIDIQSVGGANLWARINIDNHFTLGQTNIAMYTCPKDKQVSMASLFIHVETNKEVAVYGFIRDNADIVTAPYSAMRIFFQVHGLSGNETLQPKTPLFFADTPCDIGFMAVSSIGTSGVGVDFELLVTDK